MAKNANKYEVLTKLSKSQKVARRVYLQEEIRYNPPIFLVRF